MDPRTSISCGKAIREASVAWTVSANKKLKKSNQISAITRPSVAEINLSISHPSGDFWLGLDNIHSLSKQGQYVLQVELSGLAGQQQAAARYRFQLDGEEKLFTLRLEEESSPGVQEEIIMTGASGLPFSTADRDNDLAADVNCADLLSGTTASPNMCTLKGLGGFIQGEAGGGLLDKCSFVAGGWWFSSCGESNLNGRYPRRPSALRQHQSRRQGMFWTSTKGQKNSVKTTLLKIAPATMKQ